MVADAPETSVDAACQVAHAIPTHEVIDQFDYFTAVDDEAQEADERGAGMIGSIEFNSATLYRYAAVDLRELAENLDGDRDRALDLAIAFTRAFATSMPTGRADTFANHTRPEFVLLAVRDAQPVSHVTGEAGACLLLGSVVRQAVTWVDVARITMQFLR